jgi:hypothetical protein
MPALKRPLLTFLFIMLSPAVVIGGFYMYQWVTLTYLTTSSIHPREIMRIPSPDAKVDAVVVKVEGGLSTTRDPYNLYLVPPGAKVDETLASLNALDMEGLKVFWQEPKFLFIEYRQGYISQFTNLWSSKDVEKGRYVVELRLAPLSTSFSLPPADR